MTFKVQKRQCDSCIYLPTCSLDIKELEDQVRDPHMGFKGFRACHHASNKSGICCRGFWNRHKDEFAAGQIAQRLGLVEFVSVDRFATERRKPAGEPTSAGS